jgi:hypothetical protein
MVRIDDLSIAMAPMMPRSPAGLKATVRPRGVRGEVARNRFKLGPLARDARQRRADERPTVPC